MAVGEQNEKAIGAVIEQYRRGFAEMNVEMLKNIWDQDYENIIYIAQEKAQPIRGWKGVEQYYDNLERLFERVTAMTIEDLSAEIFGDVAYAFCSFHFEGTMNERSRQHFADGRNTFILLRNKSGAWKVIHYHESAKGEL